MRDGLPVFHFEGGRMELLEQCIYPLSHDLEFHHEKRLRTIAGTSRNDLDDKALLGSASNGHTCETNFTTHVTVVGQWRPPGGIERPRFADLLGPNCRMATHVGTAIHAGAFETFESRGSQGDRCGDASGGGSKPTGVVKVLDQGGALGNCTLSNGDLPPSLCDEPVRVTLAEVQRDKSFAYYFDARGVRGERSSDAPVTASELAGIASAFESEIVRLAAQRGLEITALTSPSPTSVECGVSASPEFAGYLLRCARDGVLIAQESGERALLEILAPKVASQLLDELDPPREIDESRVIGRVVVLLDMSGSMIVNDASTFSTNDIRRSHRYQLVDGLFRGILENGIDAEVAVIPFSGTSCARPLVLDGAELWRLTEASRARALDDELGPSLKAHRCPQNDGTNIAQALLRAHQLLERNRRATNGKDVVILVTDGAHNASNATIAPNVAGAELHEAGILLNVVRVQLNDLEEFRKSIKGPEGQSILIRWSYFLGKDLLVVQSDWRHRVKIISSDNDDGSKLLESLIGVSFDSFILGSNDALGDPLLTVHEYLLPQLTGVEPLEITGCERAQLIQRSDGNFGVQFFCRDVGIVPGRPVSIRVSMPECMSDVTHAFLQAPGHAAIQLAVNWTSGSTATFESAVLGNAEHAINDATDVVQSMLTVEGNPRAGVRRCRD